MKTGLRRHLTPGNAVAMAALVVALGGTAVAQVAIPNGAVTTTTLANGSVTTAKIRNGAVTKAKIASGAVNADRIAVGAVTGREDRQLRRQDREDPKLRRHVGQGRGREPHLVRPRAGNARGPQRFQGERGEGSGHRGCGRASPARDRDLPRRPAGDLGGVQVAAQSIQVHSTGPTSNGQGWSVTATSVDRAGHPSSRGGVRGPVAGPRRSARHEAGQPEAAGCGCRLAPGVAPRREPRRA